MISRTWSVALFLILGLTGTFAFAGSNFITYEGYIEANGSPSNSPTQFRFKITDSAGCSIYEETETATPTSGNFIIKVGKTGGADGTQVYFPSNISQFSQIFDTAGTINGNGCTFNSSDSRFLKVYLDPGANLLTTIELGSSGQALNSELLNGKSSAEFIQTNTDVTQARVDTLLAPAVYDNLVALNGTSTGAIEIPVGNNAQKPATPSAGMFRFNSSVGKIELYDGTSWLQFGSGAGSVTSVTNGDSYLNVATGTSTPVISVNVGTTANTLAAGNDSRIVNAIQNAGNTPSIQTGADASKPAAPAANSIYVASNSQKIYRYDSVLSQWSLIGTGNINDLLPNQSSNSGKYLTTDGTNSSWATIPAAGEVNTGSNVGTAGVGVFDSKSVADLQFKKLNPGSNKILIVDDTANKKIDIDVNQANLSIAWGQITSGVPTTISGFGITDAVNSTDPRLNPSAVAGDAGKYVQVNAGGNGYQLVTKSGVATDILPSQSTHAGEYLTTDGTNISWSPSGIAPNTIPIKKVRLATTSNISLSGLIIVDGNTVASGDRVLVKAQTNDWDNGIYVASSGAWTRATDADSWAELVGYTVFVQDGGVWSGSTFQSGATSTGTLGSTSISWNPMGASSGAVVALGTNALATGSGSHNTAIGYQSQSSSTSGLRNTSVGSNSLRYVVNGGQNTSLGYSALNQVTSGANNIGIGYGSGSAITTGSGNVVIGSIDGSSIATGNNNILIADGAGNERIHIDGSGRVGIGTSSSPTDFTVYGSGTFGTTFTVGQAGTGSNQSSVIELQTKFDGNGLGGSAGNKGWVLSARGNTYGTAVLQNDLSFNYWNGASWTNSLALDSTTGNVGIGTNDPATKLHLASGTTGTALRIVDGSQGTNKVLTSDSNGNASWQSVSTVGGLGTASTKNVPSSGDAASTEVVMGNDSRLTNSRNPSGAASGDLSNSYPNPTVSKIQGIDVSNVGPSTAQFFRYNGSSWSPANIFLSDLKGNVGPSYADLFPQGCAQNQTLTWNAATGSMQCSGIANLNASTITAGTISSSVLPFSANVWQDGGGGKTYYNGGNVGIGVSDPQALLHIKPANSWAQATIYSDGFESGLTSYTFGGITGWTTTSAQARVGSFSAVSGTITHSQNSSMSIPVSFSYDGTISFYIRTSSEDGFDFLEFYIDNLRVDRWSGLTPWTKVVYSVPAGTHTFTWNYTKDGSVSSLEDAVYIDDLVAIQDRYLPVAAVLAGKLISGNLFSSGDVQAVGKVSGKDGNFSGNVGIGTTNPTDKLHVYNGGIYAQGTTPMPFWADTFSSASYDSSAYVGTRGRGTPSAPAYPQLNDEISGVYGTDAPDYIGYSGMNIYATQNHTSTAKGTALGFFVIANNTSSSAQKMTLTNTGSLGIGTTGPLDKLQVIGDIRIGASTGFGCVRNFDGTVLSGTCSSDIRYKKNIAAISYGIREVASLEPSSYQYRAAEFPEKNWGQQTDWGLIAQQTEKIIPALVETDQNGFKSVHYEKLPILVLSGLKDFYQQYIADKVVFNTRLDKLEEENRLLKDELCKKDSSYSFCR
jgi:hypothetical protein